MVGVGVGVGIPKLYEKFWWPLFLAKSDIWIPKCAEGGEKIPSFWRLPLIALKALIVYHLIVCPTQLKVIQVFKSAFPSLPSVRRAPSQSWSTQNCTSSGDCGPGRKYVSSWHIRNVWHWYVQKTFSWQITNDSLPEWRSVGHRWSVHLFPSRWGFP